MRNIFISTLVAIKAIPFLHRPPGRILIPFSLIFASTFFNFRAFLVRGRPPLPPSSFLQVGFPAKPAGSFPLTVVSITDLVPDNSKHGNGPRNRTEKSQTQSPSRSRNRSRSRGNKKCGYSVQRPSWNAINYVVGRAASRARGGGRGRVWDPFRNPLGPVENCIGGCNGAAGRQDCVTFLALN